MKTYSNVCKIEKKQNSWNREKVNWPPINLKTTHKVLCVLYIPFVFCTEHKGWNWPSHRLAKGCLKCQGHTFFPPQYTLADWFMSSFKLGISGWGKRTHNNHIGLERASLGWNIIRWMQEEDRIATNLCVCYLGSLCLPGWRKLCSAKSHLACCITFIRAKGRKIDKLQSCSRSQNKIMIITIHAAAKEWG